MRTTFFVLAAALAACSGPLSFSKLLDGKPPASATEVAADPEDDDDEIPIGPDIYNVLQPPQERVRRALAAPRFMRGGEIASAWRVSPWHAFWFADALGDELGEH